MMSGKMHFWFMFTMIASAAIGRMTFAQLTPNFYDESCPLALKTIRKVVQEAVERERRMGASLLRLHFHDCFVNGCDASVLLDDTPNFTGEKTARPNANSLRGFDVIDNIKSALNEACGGNVVSCADILALAARDSVDMLGGPNYPVLLGRTDSLTASFNAASENLPSPFADLPALLQNFANQNLGLEDLVVLSGAHTIGLARCVVYVSRIENDTNIDSGFRAQLLQGCPDPAAQNFNTNPLDFTPTHFDTVYFDNLTKRKGLLHSDQQLFQNDGSETDDLVQFYKNNPRAFRNQFGASMIKMGNLPPTEAGGQIRQNCRVVNS